MADSAADILAPSDSTWTPPPADLPATVAAPPPSGPTPEMQQQQPQLPTSIPDQASPDYQPGERQFHESWWRKTLDAVGTILGGDQTYKISKAPDGTMTASYEPSTTGEKWGRVARAALGGAAQGLANSQGPGGLAKAAAAGTQYGLQSAEQNESDVQKKLLNAAQNAKLNQEIVRGAWNNKHLEPEYLQQQADWALKHAKDLQDIGAIPVQMGVKDHDQLTKMGVANPAAVEAHMGKDGSMVYNEPDGKGGVNFYRVPAGTANQLTTTDDPWEEIIRDPDNPGKLKHIQHMSLAGSETNGARLKRTMGNNVQNNKVLEQYAKDEKEKVPTTFEGAVIQKHIKANPQDEGKALDDAITEIKDNEKMRFRAPVINLNQGGVTQPGTQIDTLIQKGGRFAPGTVEGVNAQALSSGDQTMDQLPKRYGKGQPTPQEYFAAAEAYSQAKYGLGFSPTMIAAEKKQFENIKEQNVLNGIDRMIGVEGNPGYLDTVIQLGKAAGLGPNAPINEITQAIKKRFGSDSASSYQTALGEVQRSIPALIGNPLLGGGDTDLKLRQAQEMFAKHPTASNIQAQAETMRQMLQGSMDSYARNNRFFQRRYGLQGPYAAQYSPTQGKGKEPVSQQVNNPQNPPGAAVQAPAGATMEYKDAQGNVTGWAVGGKYVAR